ncbi:hypothetical protein [Haliangium sp.]|uniref:hypothetical protein n=1 Tax=Haliangium sp. TaxID=2663208 RepID=UPI003D0A9949
MTDDTVGVTVTSIDADVDSPAIFDPPIGHVGRLTHARLSWAGDEVKRLALTIEVDLDRLAILESTEAFGNRRADRSDNIRDGFDDSAPVEVTLWLDHDPLGRHFAGDEPSKEAALLELLTALADARSTSLTDPGSWTFESAVQRLPESSVAAGYRNRALAD